MVIARIVPYLHPAAVPERRHTIAIISPITTIVSLADVPAAPEIVDPAPLLRAVSPELLYAAIILVPPPVPIAPSIVNCLMPLWLTIPGPRRCFGSCVSAQVRN